MLLIISSKSDLTADYLIVELIRRDLKYFRLNSEEIESASCHFAIDDSGATRTIVLEQKSVDLQSVDAVWYRRAISPSCSGDISPGERHFISGELKHLVGGIVQNPGVLWVNAIERVMVAEHKLFQLQVAQRCGLQVPRSVVSDDLAVLREFVRTNPSGTICKPIYHGLFRRGMDRFAVYTRRVDPGSFDKEVECPVLLQEEVPRVCDVRVTFIGEKVFVAEIKGEAELVDWRDPGVKVSYAASKLDHATEAKCRKVLDTLGLLYGAFDFIRRPNGDLVFLEVNPTGEWAWLEENLGCPMRNAFVELFFGSR